MTKANDADKLRRLRARIDTLESELKLTRQTLAFHLGSAIVRNLSLRRFLAIPFALVRAYADYKQLRLKPSLRASAASKPTATSSATDRHSGYTHWPEPIDRHLLWQAQQIAAEHSVASACEFVDLHGDDRHAHGLNLMMSNLYVIDDERWLKGINQYLSEFNAPAIDLEAGTASRFYRVKVASKPEPVAIGPLVSVIMPAYNAAETLLHAARSILSQTWQNLELIIVDDRSSDNTYEIAQSLAREDARVHVLENAHNVGPYVSKNRGLMIARGEYITGHDADDWALPNRIELQVSFMQRNSNWQAAIGYMVRMQESGYFSHFSKMGKTSPDGVMRLASISCFFRADFLHNVVGYWDCVRFGADSEMIERCKSILGPDRFGVEPVITMLCLDAENSLTNDPRHGVSKTSGVSPTRESYRKSWMAWHEHLDSNNSYLSFPELPRRFDAPSEAIVAPEVLTELAKELTQ